MVSDLGSPGDADQIVMLKDPVMGLEILPWFKAKNEPFLIVGDKHR